MRATAGATIVFLGASLPAAEARALLPDAELHPPVAVLDVLRLLPRAASCSRARRRSGSIPS